MRKSALMAMNCMKKLLLSGSAAPRMFGSFSGLWMMLCTCWKKVLPMVPCGQQHNQQGQCFVAYFFGCPLLEVEW